MQPDETAMMKSELRRMRSLFITDFVATQINLRAGRVAAADVDRFEKRAADEWDRDYPVCSAMSLPQRVS